MNLLSRSVCRATSLSAVVSVTVLVVACSPQGPDGTADVPDPPAKGLEVVTAESVLETQPAGVTPTASFEDPADGGVVRFNSATRTFSVPAEAAAAAAARQLYSQALADGWSGTDFEDPGGTGGVPTAVLTKGSLVLELSYTTESYKENWPSDDDGFEVRMVVTDEPTTNDVMPLAVWQASAA